MPSFAQSIGAQVLSLSEGYRSFFFLPFPFVPYLFLFLFRSLALFFCLFLYFTPFKAPSITLVLSQFSSDFLSSSFPLSFFSTPISLSRLLSIHSSHFPYHPYFVDPYHHLALFFSLTLSSTNLNISSIPPILHILHPFSLVDPHERGKHRWHADQWGHHSDAKITKNILIINHIQILRLLLRLALFWRLFIMVVIRLKGCWFLAYWPDTVKRQSPSCMSSHASDKEWK